MLSNTNKQTESLGINFEGLYGKILSSDNVQVPEGFESWRGIEKEWENNGKQSKRTRKERERNRIWSKSWERVYN